MLDRFRLKPLVVGIRASLWPDSVWPDINKLYAAGWL